MRQRLEATLGHPVISFAYPYGYDPAYDADGEYVLRGVSGAGYFSARTTAVGDQTVDGCKEPLLLATSGHFRSTSMQKFDEAWKRAEAGAGGIFYIWGHSWENRDDRDWSAFEALLERFEKRPGVWYATQGQVFLWKWLRENARWEDVRVEGTKLSATLVYPQLNAFWQDRLPVTVELPAGVVRATGADQRELPINNNRITLPVSSQ